ncbi:MAG: serine protease [Desulfuromonas sp.]|nr:MAG: serine protease [Desulfuromonas sp.]
MHHQTQTLRIFARKLPFLLLLFVALSFPAYAQDKGLESLKQSGQAFRSVAQKVSPAVVFIKVEKNVDSGQSSDFNSPFDDDFFRRFFGVPRQSPHSQPKSGQRRQVGQGSGFIITADGYIMTNNHVVGDADEVQVQLLDGREYEAEIIGTDPGSDLAIIKVDEKGLPFLKLGDSDSLEMGDWVLAFGNPFGLSHTLTAGIVSAKGRSGIGLNDYEDFIQTDAAINPGNSGGPLVNLDGEVVGINSAIFSRSGGYMGIGFAIPVNMAKQIKDQLVENGEVQRGRLGVVIQDMTADLAESFDLKETAGVLVTEVIEDSPAEKAGLKQGDIVLELNGDKIENVATLRNRISLTAPGTKVRLTVLRDGERMTIRPEIDKLDLAQDGQGGAEISTLGLKLQELTPELAERYGYEDEEGVLIAAIESDSQAARSGLTKGALILEIDRQRVTSVAEAKKLLKADKRMHLLLVRSGQMTQYIALRVK